MKNRCLTRSEALDFDPVNVRVARALTKQIVRSGILCPTCLTFGEERTLQRADGEEEMLICPHCELQIILAVDGWYHHYNRRAAHEWLRHIDTEGGIHK